jgi:hypothetical protein
VDNMNGEQSYDMIDAGAYSVEELREATFEGRGRLSRPLALALLGRKNYPQKVQDLERVLTNEQEMPRLRAMSAQFLGEIGGPDATRVLERGLDTRQGVTLRAVALALGKTGSREHVSRLESLAQRPDPVGKTARRALDVLSNRVQDAGTTRVSPEPPRLTPGQNERTTAIDVGAPSDGDLAGAIRGVPSRRLSRNSALSLRCQGRDLIFLFAEDAVRRGVDLFVNQGEIGVVTERRKVEGTGWEERYRVIVEPRPNRVFSVVVTTHDARPLLRGEGQIRGQEAQFQLGSIDAPGAIPVEIRGRFDGRRLAIDEARSSQRRRPSKTPSSLHRP